MSELLSYAKRELSAAGMLDPDSDYAGAAGNAVLELVKVFGEQEHSGASAGLVLAAFDRVARFRPLTPITDDPADWMEVGPSVWQSRRSPTLFSTDGGTTHYDLDEPGQPLHETQRR